MERTIGAKVLGELLDIGPEATRALRMLAQYEPEYIEETGNVIRRDKRPGYGWDINLADAEEFATWLKSHKEIGTDEFELPDHIREMVGEQHFALEELVGKDSLSAVNYTDPSLSRRQIERQNVLARMIAELVYGAIG